MQTKPTITVKKISGYSKMQVRVHDPSICFDWTDSVDTAAFWIERKVEKLKKRGVNLWAIAKAHTEDSVLDITETKHRSPLKLKLEDGLRETAHWMKGGQMSEKPKTYAELVMDLKDVNHWRAMDKTAHADLLDDRAKWRKMYQDKERAFNRARIDLHSAQKERDAKYREAMEMRGQLSLAKEAKNTVVIQLQEEQGLAEERMVKIRLLSDDNRNLSLDHQRTSKEMKGLRDTVQQETSARAHWYNCFVETDKKARVRLEDLNKQSGIVSTLKRQLGKMTADYDSLFFVFERSSNGTNGSGGEEIGPWRHGPVHPSTCWTNHGPDSQSSKG